MIKEYLLKTKLSFDIINIICKYEFTLENLHRIHKNKKPIQFKSGYIVKSLIKALKYGYSGFLIDFYTISDCMFYFNNWKDIINNERTTIKLYDKSISISVNGLKENLLGFVVLNFLK
jgi:hypothetical protein